jgi:hypothetical protein
LYIGFSIAWVESASKDTQSKVLINMLMNCELSSAVHSRTMSKLKVLVKNRVQSQGMIPKVHSLLRPWCVASLMRCDVAGALRLRCCVAAALRHRWCVTTSLVRCEIGGALRLPCCVASALRRRWCVATLRCLLVCLVTGVKPIYPALWNIPLLRTSLTVDEVCLI